jgi:uncharacterized protein YacL
MILHVLRALFVLLMGAVGYFLLLQPTEVFGQFTWLTMMLTLAVGVFIVCVDILAPRRKLAVFSGTFLGLVVGLFIAYALSFVVTLIVDNYIPAISESAGAWLSMIPKGSNIKNRDVIVRNVNLVMGVICCYLSISFILQTKDDFRFIIPYVEFQKQTKGSRPVVLDTSALIDGRINDVVQTGVLEGQLIVPRFVLDELQLIADSSDKLKRNRGRRGLDMLTKLRGLKQTEVFIYDHSVHSETEVEGVDQKLLALAQQLGARVMTTDFNLNKVAQLRGVDVININDLANSLKPVVLPGEKMQVRLVKSGEEPGQGVGYLDDGTMVVVEQGRGHLNEEVEFTVTSALQTSAGRMIFGRMGEAATANASHGSVGGGAGGGHSHGQGPRRTKPQTEAHS